MWFFQGQDADGSRVPVLSSTAKEPIQPRTELLGSLGPRVDDEYAETYPEDINAVWPDCRDIDSRRGYHGGGKFMHFGPRPTGRSTLPPMTSALLAAIDSVAHAINEIGQVTGVAELPIVGSYTSGEIHAFRTAPNRPINAATDDLGTLGWFKLRHSRLTTRVRLQGRRDSKPEQRTRSGRRRIEPINPATDDLGTLGGRDSWALGINNAGHVVGGSSHRPEIGLIVMSPY